MRGRLNALLWVTVLGCSGISGGGPAPAPVREVAPWRPPAVATDPGALSIQPVSLAVPRAEVVELRLAGARAGDAHCTWSGGEARGPVLHVTARGAGGEGTGTLDIQCRAGEARADAQLTYTDARTLPVRDPYAGGVALFKTRRSPEPFAGGRGTQALGIPSVDRILRGLGAWAFPAFPFDRSGTIERVGLARWIVVEIPEGANFYQAVALLRGDGKVWPESYLPLDGSFLRVRSDGDWPVGFDLITRQDSTPSTEIEPTALTRGARDLSGARELADMGASAAWERATGTGVTIAVVDTGVDVDHPALAEGVRKKKLERVHADGDGNGIPGDVTGVNFAHLAISSGDGPPRLALGLLGDSSDWDGADRGLPASRWGHGTALAALAAGGAAGRVGVAPDARVLAIDVQENLRASRFDPDPRMRAPRAASADDPLRTSLWAQAAGVAYAAAEGADVVTCAWRNVGAAWILHDALLYAEDNCVVSVCGADAGAPAEWAQVRLPGRSDASGEERDAWTGELHEDFFQRPLRGTLVVATKRAQAPYDLRIAVPRGLRSAVSDPFDAVDSAGRLAPPPESTVGVGLVAGAAALIRELRPDLEPWSVRAALRGSSKGGRLDVPAALDAAAALPTGECQGTIAERRERERLARQPFWKHGRIKVTRERADDLAPLPGSSDEEEDEPMGEGRRRR